MNTEKISLVIVFMLAGSHRVLSQPLSMLPEPRQYWSFDTIAQNHYSSGMVEGYFTEKPGVKGNCFNFDGFTTRIMASPSDLPDWNQGFTIEAWIAPQEYSWAWTGIFDQAQDTTRGFSFGINYLGQIGFQAVINNKWTEAISEEAVPLLEWSHVAGSFEPLNGLKVYINGKLVASNNMKGSLGISHTLAPVIGKSHRKQYPALTERKNSMQFLSGMYFDGLMDEMKLYDKSEIK